MKKLLLIFLLFSGSLSFGQTATSESTSPHAAAGASIDDTLQLQRKPVSPEQAQADFIAISKTIAIDEIRTMATQQNGRIKPFDSLAREYILYVNGRYSRWDLHPVQMYLGLILSASSPWLEFVEVRDPELRTKLGFLPTKRFFSLAELESSNLQSLAGPLLEKQQQAPRTLEPDEKKVLETYSQVSVLQAIIMSQHLLQAVDFSIFDNNRIPSSHNPEVQEKINRYLAALSKKDSANIVPSTHDLVSFSQGQKTPDMFTHFMSKINTEIFYNDFRPFFWASLLFLVLGALFFIPAARNRLGRRGALAFFIVPLALQITGIALRVYITQFAPVTNMYGTMIWVSLGVNVFSLVLFFLYQNYLVSGITLIGTGLILLLTESIPLILSPDLDPIVAVLRNNFWLSTHVTTITISYAAFTIAMLIGNTALIRLWTHKDDAKFYKEYAHYAYRMVQLGCFLLTAGIILGGIWADYSWGRFWGWDPKETWALIADLGFLALMHAKYIGWASNFAFLAAAPVAYLMVIMAWYGVNFILAAGLHSYGFSSGGATMVAVFVILQLLLLGAGVAKMKLTANREKSVTR